jgi:hypothetical protein
MRSKLNALLDTFWSDLAEAGASILDNRPLSHRSVLAWLSWIGVCLITLILLQAIRWLSG